MVVKNWQEVKFSRKSANDYLASWDIGSDIDPGDVANYLAEGYSKNSLIFSCIDEIATSFAALPIMLAQPTPDGMEPVDTHEVLDLLANPSDYCDSYEFMHALMTHHRATGNVYIRKVRKSNNPQRNRDFRGPIKELHLIRPDYVTIKAGRTREDDVFVVKVSGQTKAVYPRKDIIHIKTANMVNDFYGMSPIALLIYEGNVDTEMTKFDWAFFRNAGVPMGILQTKRKPTPDEAKEIKGAFRRMFGGVKKWFEVMILPAEEASYQQLGLALKDMEMTETRSHVESRICAVFGVPAILVGARVGLESAGGLTTTSVEAAEFSFWSETMPPLCMAVSSALTRELFSEYRTTSTRRHKLMFDLSEVKALQEDNTERLEGTARLITTGGFTVNEALGLHGLPLVEQGDFYVRTVAQVVETPQAQQIGRVAVLAPAPKQLKQAAPSRDRLTNRAEKDIETFLADQSIRIAAQAIKSQKSVNWDSEAEELLNVIRPHFVAGLQVGWEFGGELIADSLPFDILDPSMVSALSDAGERITGINDETKRLVQSILLDGRERGLSPRQIADNIRASGAFSQSRAEMIARTELAIADNQGAVSRYEKAGLTHVEVIDGDSDEACASAHGEIWTLDRALGEPTQHPNAVLEGSTFAAYGGLREMIRSRYRGVAIRITAGGAALGQHFTTIGPNHPILTVRGFVKARDLREGDQVVYDLRHNFARASSGESNLKQVESVEDVFEAIIPVGTHSRVAATRDDFHGDAIFCEEEIDVVWPDNELLHVIETGVEVHQVRQPILVGANAQSQLVPASGPHLPYSERVLLAASSGMGGSGDGVDSASHFTLLTIESTEPVLFEGWAYDATTYSSLYCSDGLVVSNCVRSFAPVIGG